MTTTRAPDLTGKVFRSWTVLHRAPDSGGPGRHARWVCRCTCGNEASVLSTTLKRGESQSCGKGSCNWRWKGDDVAYFGAHHRLIKALGSAREHPCADCGEPAREWSYDNLDPDERTQEVRGSLIRYSLKQAHYSPRCARCHRSFDRDERAS